MARIQLTPTARFALAATEFGGRLFAVGGSDGYRTLPVVESFDRAGWRTETPMARPRQLLALVPFAGRLFALGGRGPGPAGAAHAGRDPGDHCPGPGGWSDEIERQPWARHGKYLHSRHIAAAPAVLDAPLR